HRVKLFDSLNKILQKCPSAQLFLPGRKLIRNEVEKHLARRAATRSKLRGWLAQKKIYFTLMGWTNDHDQEKITYTTSLLRGDAETWITPYIESIKRQTWETWSQFTEELNNQFGMIEKKGEARNRLKHITQGK